MPEKSRYPNGGRFTKGNTHNRRGHRKSYISKGIEEHRLVVETRLETETEMAKKERQVYKSITEISIELGARLKQFN